jgi:hypothetical protein
VGHLRYHEVEEIKAGVKRTVGDRRIKVANNIRVRRAGLALSKASDLNELLGAVAQMLEFGEFAYANAQLGRAGNADVNERALRVAGGGRSLSGAELRGGRIWWSWQRGDIDPDKIVRSPHFWSVRLPLLTEKGEWGWINLYRPLNNDPLLVDINHLCDLFRCEMSAATERILQTSEERVSATKLAMKVSAGKVTS